MSVRRIAFRPVAPNEDSFQSFVPTGNCQASASDASMVAPGGSRIHRRFVAPSVQSGYCGLNGRLSAAIVFASKSA